MKKQKKIALLFKNNSLHKFIIYGSGQFFNLVTPLLVVPHIVKTCGVENLGKTATAMAIAFFLIVFVDYGSDIVGTKEVSINRNNPKMLEKIFCITYSIKTITLLLVLLLASFGFLLIPFFAKEKTLFFLTLSVLIGQFINPTWFLQGVENVKWITVTNIITKSVYLIGVFLFVKKTTDYVYVNFWWGLGMIVGNTLVFIYIWKKHKFSFVWFSKKEILTHLKKDFTLFSSQLFVSIQNYAPILLISLFGSNFLAGQYKIIDQIVSVFKTYFIIISNFFYPKTCYAIKIDEKKGIRSWLVFNGVNYIFVLFFVFLLYVFATEVILYFNPQNIQQLVVLLKIALLIPIIIGVSMALRQLLLAFNYKKFYIQTIYFTTIINLVLIVLLLPILKLFGVLLAIICSETIMTFLFLYQLRKKLFLKPLK